MPDINNICEDLAFIILVGGKSSRFGSDKGLYKFLGKPLISYQLETLIPFKKDIFLVAHSKEQVKEYIKIVEYYKISGFILDVMKDFEFISHHSSMLGLYSAFKELSTLGYKRVFTISCDMPFIKKEIIELLINKSDGFDCCIPKWEDSLLEPLFAI